jgi:hypothetical protein
MTKFPAITNWDELVSFLQRIPPVDMACRGEPRKYLDMKSRLDRCLDIGDLKDRLRMERAICQRFREHAPIHLSNVELRYLETRWLQLIVMQHYGAPTRLLDWTKSPWVAAFFAACDAFDSSGFIYAFRRDRLETKLLEEFGDELRKRRGSRGTMIVWGPHSTDQIFSGRNWDAAETNDVLFEYGTVQTLHEWIATYYCREAHFPRLIAQQGLFTFSSKPGVDHWHLITNLLSEDDWYVVEIERAAKPDILRRLNGVGLNGATLFPGPDGIGRSLEGFARAWHLTPKPSQF